MGWKDGNTKTPFMKIEEGKKYRIRVLLPFKCRKCGKNKCVAVPYQHRALDEGVGNLVRCLTCGNTWEDN